jgi:polyhydroxybutyrate depolymerase
VLLGGCDEAPTAAPPPTTTTATTTTTTTTPLSVGVSHGTITVDGRQRTYRLYVPADLPDGPVPLFVALHGGTGWADQFARTNGVEAIADERGFIVVHPDGVPQPGTGHGEVWNGGVCCGIAARTGVDDVAFVDALLDDLEAHAPIDTARVFAFGHSNGAIMSYRLACDLADRITGIAMWAGTLGVEPCAPSQPVSVLHLHGDADENIPIEGGVGSRSISGVSFPPPRDGFATLADADGCPAAERSTPSGRTEQRREPCVDGTAARFVTVAGAPHAWPTTFDATAEIVDFLLAHPRR